MKRKTMAILLAVVWTAVIIAIIAVFRWATSSPSLETLIAVDTGIGIAIFGGMFSATLAVIEAISRIESRISGVEDRISEVKSSISENSNRIIEAIRGGRDG